MKLVSNVSRAAKALLLVFAVIGGSALAQEFRGTISGQVNDPSGAAVPGATVTVRETHTGTLNKTRSDAAGQYVVPFLLPGDYQITVENPGFQTTTQSNVTLDAQGHPIVNLSMQVGSETETVTVTTAPPLIDEANASIGQVIDTKQVEDLPLNGRTPVVLAELSAGVITTSAPGIVHPFDNNAGNSWSMGGTPSQISEVLLDGSPDLTLLGAQAYSPVQDSVAQVSIRPFDTDASFGHTIGGVINQITKSGTNSFHGTVYEFNQIPNLDANYYFNKRGGVARPVFHYNQYGLTFGGPVSIPKLYSGKDKLFFFFAFEGLKDSQPGSQTMTVPTAAERTGDFSQILAAGCPGGYANDPTKAAAICNPYGTATKPYADPNQLYNPYNPTGTSSSFTRQAILNNQLTSVGTAFNPISQAYLALIPLPNVTQGVQPNGQSNYISSAASVDRYNNEFGRLDYNLSSRDHIFFDIRHNSRGQVKNDYFGNGLTGTTLTRENFGTTLDNVFTLNPTTVIDTRVNWTFFNESHGTPAQKYTPTQVGFPSNLQSNSALVQLPAINFTGSCGSFTSFTCVGDTSAAIDPTTSYQAFADVVKILGNHTLKVGFDGRLYKLTVENYGASAGSFTFGSNWMSGNSSSASSTTIFGADLASFLFGLPTSGTYNTPARADYHQFYIGSFVQDDWRVSNKLTLNMGLRFDIDTPYREKNGAIVNGFNPTAANSASAAATAAFKAQSVTANGQVYAISSLNTLGGLTFPNQAGGAVYATNSGFVSPRFGFSYSVTPATVVRGGFGIFVQPEVLSTLGSNGTYSSNALTDNEGFSASTTFNPTTNNYFSPAATLSNPVPNGFVAPAGSSAGASTFLGQTISFLAPVEHDPYSERWNFDTQHSFGSHTLIEAIYVGNHALHLPVQQQNLNAPLLQYLTTAPYRNQNLNTAFSAKVANPYSGLLPNGGTANSSTVAVSNLMYPFPQYGTTNVYVQNQTIGQSYFSSAIAHIEQRNFHGLTLTANYSFSKMTEADTFLNDEDTQLTHRVSPFDHTHHFTVGGTYELPFGKGKMFDFGGSRVWNEVLGGFTINSVYQFQTGAPVVFTADLPLNQGVNVRQIRINPRNTSASQATAAIPSSTVGVGVGPFITGSATACPKDANGNTIACDLSGASPFNGQYYMHYRTLPQTLSWVRGDGFNNLDASILKNFSFTERTYLQVRFETFNTLNHAVFAAPNVSSATSSSFGEVNAVASNSLPRQVQLGARLVF